jgi:hypothetical protein
MRMHASLIWPSLIVLALLGPGWNAWPSQDSPIRPGGAAATEAVIPAAAQHPPEGFDRLSAEQGSRTTNRKAEIKRRTRSSHSSSAPEARTGKRYFVSANPRSGAGTIADPFGVIDLLNPDHSPGRALTVLGPGDTLYFRKGDYHITGHSGPNLWDRQLLSPSVSGTPSRPITLQAYPGETVRILVDGANGRPVFGTSTPTLNYVRFIGFTVEPGPVAAFYLRGTGNEVAYCDVLGHYAATTDNHDAIRIDSANSAWIHHNNVHGLTGDGPNSCGIKVYQSTNLLIEDNYVHDNITGIHDKDAGTLGDGTNQNTYTRNWITNNQTDQFRGNNQNHQALYYIHDNVVDGVINLYSHNTGSQIYNNLVRTNGAVNARALGIASWMSSYQENIWNNIIIANKRAVWGYGASVPFSSGRPESPLRYMDYNVYDSTPAFLFDGVTYTLAQLQSRGFERHSAVVAGQLSIFRDLTSYELKPRWLKAGRYGDPVGPRFPVARILDTRRYGPSALKTGNPPIITQQPQDQVASRGGITTFSVHATGSELSFQWEWSTDGGSTWMIIQGANSPVLTIPKTPASDDGAVFRCLVSCVGGSVASDSATLTINAADPILK